MSVKTEDLTLWRQKRSRDAIMKISFLCWFDAHGITKCLKHHIRSLARSFVFIMKYYTLINLNSSMAHAIQLLCTCTTITKCVVGNWIELHCGSFLCVVDNVDFFGSSISSTSLEAFIWGSNDYKLKHINPKCLFSDVFTVEYWRASSTQKYELWTCDRGILLA